MRDPELAAEIAKLRTQAMARGEEEVRKLIIAEAMTWLHTPYHHQSGVKGAGVDCVYLIVRVYQAVGLMPVDRYLNPTPYAQQWHLHRDEELYLLGFEAYLRPVEVPKPGDIALYRFGRTVSHGAFVVDDELIIHAWAQSRQVNLTEGRTIAERLHGYYTIF